MHDPMTFEGRLAEARAATRTEPTLMSPRSTWPQRSRRARDAAGFPCHGLPGPWAPQVYFPCLQWLPEVSQ